MNHTDVFTKPHHVNSRKMIFIRQNTSRIIISGGAIIEVQRFQSVLVKSFNPNTFFQFLA